MSAGDQCRIAESPGACMCLPDPAFAKPEGLYAGILRYLFLCGIPWLGVVLYANGNIHKVLR